MWSAVCYGLMKWLKIFNDMRSLSISILMLILGAVQAWAGAYPQLTNIPTIYMTTDGNASVQHDTYVKGTITVVSSDASECMIERPFQIKGRGNSTWNMSKKPYSIQLDSAINFLGMNAKARKWDFIANYADKTLMRGAVAFHLSQFVGLEFTPGERFVDVYLNGSYMGNYHVTDHMERGENRVPVEEGTDADCGYFCEVDGWATSEPHYFTTSKDVPITIHYPENPRSAQTSYITKCVQEFETRLFSSQFTDEANGYRPLIDTTSLINWYVAIELVGNSDAFWSTFFYKKQGDAKLYVGPMWDYDIAFNNDDRLGDATNKVMRDNAHKYLTWIQRLWQDPWFRHAANRRLNELIQAGVEQELDNYIDLKAKELELSQQENFKKWNILSTHVYHEVKLYNTYAEGVAYLKTYINQRIKFLQQNFEKEDTGSSITPDPVPANEINSKYLYTIKGKTSGLYIDTYKHDSLPGTKLVSMSLDVESNTQLWYVHYLTNGYYMIYNYGAKLAVGDAGVYKNAMQLMEPDSTNEQQQWELFNCDDDWYMIINKASGYGFNNEGGSSAEGTQVIAYDVNKSSSSSNRRWCFMQSKLKPADEEPISALADIEDNKEMTRKIIRNGQLYILRNNHIYTITGQYIQ